MILLLRTSSQPVYNRVSIFAYSTQGEHACGALLDTSGASNALRVLHGGAFVGYVHDIDALMTDAGADIAGDAFLLVREDAKLAKSGIDVHKGCEWAGKAAPDTS